MPYKDPQAKLAYNRAYHIAHRKERLAASKAHHIAHRDERLAAKKSYLVTHAKEVEAYQKAYHIAHPEKHAARDKRRRARKRNAPLNDFTAAQWREMQKHYKHRCQYCRKICKGKLTMDHITPLSKGGSHTLTNILPCCQSCNSRKHTGPAPIPVQPMLL